MKEIFIITSYLSGNGGIEKVIQEMMKIYPKHEYHFNILSLTGGDDVKKVDKSIICYTGSESWLKKISEVDSFRFPFGSKIKLLNVLFHIIYSFFLVVKISPHAIICTGPSMPKYLSAFKRLLKKKYTIYMWPHFSLNSGFGKFKNMKYADYILSISKGIARQCSEMGIEKEKIVYFPNPFENKKNDIVKSLSKKINDIKKERVITFNYIGRILLHGQKNLRELLDCIPILEGEFKVNIIGDGPEEDIKIIKDFIEKFNLAEKVYLHQGWFSDPWGILSEDDNNFLILTSIFEGLPTVLGEALSRGIPCISSNCETGPEDFIVNNMNGYLYPVGDKEYLLEILQSIINDNISFDPLYVNESIKFLYTDEYLKRVGKLRGR